LKVLIHNIILGIQLLPTEICDNILDILSQRWSKMYHPVMKVAYLLDPQFIGRNLDADGMTIIYTILSNQSRDYLYTNTSI